MPHRIQRQTQRCGSPCGSSGPYTGGVHVEAAVVMVADRNTPALRPFLARVQRKLDARSDDAANEIVTGMLGPNGAGGTDDDVVRVVLALLVRPATGSDGSATAFASDIRRSVRGGSDRISATMTPIALADGMGSSDLGTWRELYARATTDEVFRQRLLRATAMIDSVAARSAAVWRTLGNRIPGIATATDTAPSESVDGSLMASSRAIRVAATSHRLFGVPWAEWDGARVAMRDPQDLPLILDLTPDGSRAALGAGGEGAARAGARHPHGYPAPRLLCVDRGLAEPRRPCNSAATQPPGRDRGARGRSRPSHRAGRPHHARVWKR